MLDMGPQVERQGFLQSMLMVAAQVADKIRMSGGLAELQLAAI
jgi:hypothetical protein